MKYLQSLGYCRNGRIRHCSICLQVSTKHSHWQFIKQLSDNGKKTIYLKKHGEHVRRRDRNRYSLIDGGVWWRRRVFFRDQGFSLLRHGPYFCARRITILTEARRWRDTGNGGILQSAPRFNARKLELKCARSRLRVRRNEKGTIGAGNRECREWSHCREPVTGFF